MPAGPTCCAVHRQTLRMVRLELLFCRMTQLRHPHLILCLANRPHVKATGFITLYLAPQPQPVG